MTMNRLFASTIIAASAFVGLGFMASEASALSLPACAEEDGNTDGLPCTWTDSDTGISYFVDSSNYR